MPPKSESQRRAAAIAEHHPEKAKGAAKEMAKSMSKKQLHDFASTPSKNLPEHVSKEGLDGFLDGYREKQAGEFGRPGEFSTLDEAAEWKPFGRATKKLQLERQVEEAQQAYAAGRPTVDALDKLREADVANMSSEDKKLWETAAEAAKGSEDTPGAQRTIFERLRSEAAPSLGGSLKNMATQIGRAVKKPQLEKQVAQAQQRHEIERPTQENWLKQQAPKDEPMAALAPKPSGAALAAAPSLKDRLLASLQGGFGSAKKFVGEYPAATGIAAGVAGGAGLAGAAMALKQKLEAKKKPVRRVAVA